jgi:hypothetical protein
MVYNNFITHFDQIKRSKENVSPFHVRSTIKCCHFWVKLTCGKYGMCIIFLCFNLSKLSSKIGYKDKQRLLKLTPGTNLMKVLGAYLDA